MARHYPEKFRRQIWRESNKTCFYCGVEMTYIGAPSKPNKMTVEHLVPLSKGGASDTQNCVAACFACNNSRRAKSIKEFVDATSIRKKTDSQAE